MRKLVEKSINVLPERKYPLYKVVYRIVTMQVKTTPFHILLSILLSLISGFMILFIVMVTQRLFDSISDAAMGFAIFRDVFTPLLIYTSVTLGSQVLSVLYNLHLTILLSKSQGRIMALLQKKLQRIDAAFFENTDFLDDLNKAREATFVIPHFTMVAYMIVFFYGTFFISIGVYLFNLKPILLITIAIAFVPAMLSQYVRTKIFTKLETQSAPLRREVEYYQRSICDREYFKETRILGAYKFFHKLFTDTITLLMQKMWRSERKATILNVSLNLTSFLGMAAVTYFLFTATMSGEITVGAFAAVFAALSNIFQIMQEIVNYQIGTLSNNFGKVMNFVKTMDTIERDGENLTPEFSKGIVAANISFMYPGRDTYAVNDISLNISPGETIAIVGENGAGKSTLVRLLTGIYLPTEGNVTVGGLNTKNTAPAYMFSGLSGVFQKYQRYKMTLRENVTISALDSEISGNAHNDIKILTEETKIKTALKEAGSELSDAELDDMLAPDFDGIDLSGGQWQRLAIARGIYRDNGYIILDEPTAAIDPIEEKRVFEQFEKLAKNKCAILVTHRLGSVKLANRVIVLDEGKIVDIGTHDELIKRPGKY
ncbi:MAG: ABC transporter ATP-binding protein/permease, partial [Oscillospiraceae bacterium]|nr:ABC transporter ATP-binding protein/permease [Oscillospiraceae bacterium]